MLDQRCGENAPVGVRMKGEGGCSEIFQIRAPDALLPAFLFLQIRDIEICIDIIFKRVGQFIRFRFF